MSDIEDGTSQRQSYFISSPDTGSSYGTRTLPGPGITASFFIQKSADALDTGAKTEDTLAWKSDPSGQVIAFAVCDGVGGSYLGYVSSQFLAEKIVSTLHDGALEAPEGALPTPETMLSVMNGWIAEGQSRLDDQPITGNINPFLAEVLRNRRRDGSHSVFFCGCIDMRPGRKSVFCWMGNVTGQVFDSHGRALLDLQQMRDDRERWTTAHGCLGTPHLQAIATEQVRRVLVATDGLAVQFGEMSRLYAHKAEADYLPTLRQSNYTDDATMLSLWLPGGEIDPLPDLPIIDLTARDTEPLAVMGTASAPRSEGASGLSGASPEFAQPGPSSEEASAHGYTNPQEPSPQRWGPQSLYQQAAVDTSRPQAADGRMASSYYGSLASVKPSRPNYLLFVGLGTGLVGLLLVVLAATLLMGRREPPGTVEKPSLIPSATLTASSVMMSAQPTTTSTPMPAAEANPSNNSGSAPPEIKVPTTAPAATNTPETTNTPASAPSTGPTDNPPPGMDWYQVKSDDGSLTNIAERCGMGFTEVDDKFCNPNRDAGKLTNCDEIYPGQWIAVPKECIPKLGGH